MRRLADILYICCRLTLKNPTMKRLILIACLFFCFSCVSKAVEQTPNGVIVRLDTRASNTPRQVRLEIVTPDIIRVSVTPEKQFNHRASLIIVEQKHPVPEFRVEEDEQSVRLVTSELTATISKETLAVGFADKNGRDLLAEQNSGGREFIPIEVEGDKGYSFRQIFESPDDEAFYGLGQHQSDEFNYKGKNETLYQYNTKVSVPFLISNKGYGILWDNYSLMRFGDRREYANLNQFKLYGKDGHAGGLTATYVPEKEPEKGTVVRTESIIEYENLDQLERFPEGFRFSNSSVTWEGEIEAPETGIYRFILYYGGYTSVFIDDELIVEERWRTAWNPNSYKFNLDMTQGERRRMRIEWRPDGGQSYIGLKALSPVPDEVQGKMAWWAEMGDMIDYYFIKGDDMDEVISGYRTLTGKAQIMPKWAMGFWQSRERYKTQEELLSTVAEYRRRGIPLDNIVQDWSYWPQDAWGSHEFDPQRFPDPQGMVDSVHAMDARIMVSVWPKFYHTTEHYNEFDAKGWMYRRAVQDSIRDWIGKGYIGSFYDAYAPGARKLFWEQMREHLYDLGMDAWWMDASEPDILSNADLDYRKALSSPTALGASTRFLNTYSLVNAEAIYDGQRSVNPNDRVFLLTRSGFAGLQRYSTATWSGDIGTRWEDMKAQISAGLNFSLSGIPYWTMDIGGFCVEKRYEKAKEGSEDLEEWRELNARWFQFGAFCPLFRSHGQYPYREIYNIAPEGHPAYESMVYYDKLRYRLMPYIYSLAGETYWNDGTIMRPLVMDFGDDPTTGDIGDQYLFGPSILVAPVYEYKARTRRVYFPAHTEWYDFHTGEPVSVGESGWKTVEAPYGRMPMFVRAGSIIPVGPDIQHTAEQTDGSLTLMVFGGPSRNFDLYEDEGVNYNYEQGAYSRIPFSYDGQTETLTIDARQGNFAGMPEVRELRIVYVTPGTDNYRNISSQPIKTIVYNGTAQRIELK